MTTARLIVLVAAWLTIWPAHGAEHPDARTTSIDATPYRVAAAHRYALSVDTADVLRHLDLVTAVGLRLERRPLGLRDVDTGDWIRSLVDYRDSLDLNLSLGLFGRAEVALGLPVTLTQSASLPGKGLGPVASDGYGDTLIRLKVVLLEQDAGLTVALDLPVSLPTGDAGAYMSSGELTAAPAVLVTRTKGGTQATFRLTYVYLREVSIFDLSTAHEVRPAFGVVTPIAGVSKNLRVSAEVVGRVPATTDLLGHAQLGASWGAGLSFRHTFGLGYGLYAGGAMTASSQTPSIRGGLQMSYRHAFGVHPPVCDFPGAYLADPRCPPDDTDKDGVADPDDKCPRDPEDVDQYEDGDGCPDADNDADDILDSADKCPNEAEDADGFEDEDGCPDLDNDKDGIPDAEDQCPQEAENLNGVADTDGCPEPDADNDGVLDADDKCPAQPEDRDGYQDDDGCPDPDNDQDGIPDSDDLCPDQKENINGNKDTDGCPDEVLAVKTEKEIAITEEIHFVLGQVVPRRRSRKVLKAIIRVLRKHPALVIRVEGYTDGYGGEDFNYYLSRARAQAIRDYLVRMGAPKDNLDARIQTIGRGKENPSGSNKTLVGRAKNRRVRFVIVPKVDR